MSMSMTDVRLALYQKLYSGTFVTDKSGVKTIELEGASFVAKAPGLFGTVNWDYVQRELEWYESMSLSVHDIPGGPPKIWLQVADKDGMINSNYGAITWGARPGGKNQYQLVKEELRSNPQSRRAVIIYQRPEMWELYNENGRSDFCCTNAVQFMLRERNGKTYLDCVVQMRSNDAVFGYNNDQPWHDHVLGLMAADLEVEKGEIVWQAGSFHVYERHFFLVDYWGETGCETITKAEYRELHPGSEWAR